jgi:hypothetical protein
VHIGSATSTPSGPNKWDKNPPKDKITLAKKKSWDIAKVQCFNCKELGRFAKNCEKGKLRLGIKGIHRKGECGQVGPKFNHV